MPTKDNIDIPQVLYQVKEEDDREVSEWADDKLWHKENPYISTSLNSALSKLSITVDIAIKAFRQMAKALGDYVYDRYPNRRVVHLALHGKRARTRKKNRHRIWRDLKLEMKRKKGKTTNE